jgi:hypothetical protein
MPQCIESLINTTFWASLRREEGLRAEAVAGVPAAGRDTRAAMRFEQPRALSPSARCQGGAGGRTRRHPSRHLAHDGELCAWGTTRSIPRMCFVLEVIEPGLLVVKHTAARSRASIVNVRGARRRSGEARGRDGRPSLPDCPALISVAARVRLALVVGRLGERARAAGGVDARARAGGLLLIVPSASETGANRWSADDVRDLAALSRAERAAAPERHGERPRRFQESLREVVDVVAGLTAVDGAAVMTDAYELLAFGAKIARRRGSPQVELVTVTEPVVGGVRAP